MHWSTAQIAGAQCNSPQQVLCKETPWEWPRRAGFLWGNVKIRASQTTGRGCGKEKESGAKLDGDRSKIIPTHRLQPELVFFGKCLNLLVFDLTCS